MEILVPLLSLIITLVVIVVTAVAGVLVFRNAHGQSYIDQANSGFKLYEANYQALNVKVNRQEREIGDLRDDLDYIRRVRDREKVASDFLARENGSLHRIIQAILPILAKNNPEIKAKIEAELETLRDDKMKVEQEISDMARMDRAAADRMAKKGDRPVEEVSERA